MAEDKAQQLRQHFSRRVLDQARVVIGIWYSLEEVHWNQHWFEQFCGSIERLEKFSQRLLVEPFINVSLQMQTLVGRCDGLKAPSTELLSQMDQAILQLSQLSIRRTDNTLDQVASLGNKPIYVAFEKGHINHLFSDQLQSFGLSVERFFTLEDLNYALDYRLPSAVILDVDFCGKEKGLAFIESVQQKLTKPLNVFFSASNNDINAKLRAVRAEVIGYQLGVLEASLVIERLDQISEVIYNTPFRVLVVEDSKTQSMQIERHLNSAGMLTQAVNQPLTVFDAIFDFEPEIILMDMYMPECSGVELARVIRQQPEYDSLPIIFLSAEQDIKKQIEAVSYGADDFLIKGGDGAYLVARVQNKCRRNRVLIAKMERDGLTGLLDHSHSLRQLALEVKRHRDNQTNLCFVMIDLDHFKQVNDQYGHFVGDRVIKNLSLFLKQRLRKTDTAGRYGGEEFAIILPDVSAENALKLIEQLLDGFMQIEHKTEENAIHVSFSAGIAQLSADDSPKQLAQKADKALYQAKEAGRKQVQIYQAD